ncbi:rab protein geranylgeranyltransferase component a [Anaeramoeba flamelloides]|uniref:Rab protein geranylgeranyltransferase component a n=1 Tax=Anaeramoeba flamelloides TaxID=1746091 RepID=A0ABQ8Z6B6_9EUKA|nr:rab protein geranylgeranyltransferase component a [Anaeramoeba flamelloides]
MEKIEDADVIILGTGITSTLISASLSRLKKKVLHMDFKPYYGSEMSTLSFKEFYSLFDQKIKTEEKETEKEKEKDNEKEEEKEETKETTNFTFSDSIKPVPLIFEESFTESSLTFPKPEVRRFWVFPKKEEEKEKEKQEKIENKKQKEGEEEEEKEKEKEEKDNEKEEEKVEKKENEKEEEKEEKQKEEEEEKMGEKEKEKEKKKDVPEQIGSLEWLKCKSNRFMIDLQPHYIFARSEILKIIATSNLTHYIDFQLLGSIQLLHEGKLQALPCSRSEIFKTKSLELIEKRFLMKFITHCTKYSTNEIEDEEVLDEIKSWLEKPFTDFLTKYYKFNTKLHDFVFYTIIMATSKSEIENYKTKDGIKNVYKYIISMNRFQGTTPILWPQYGISGFPQGFCRSSAIYGGTFMLNSFVQKLVLKENNQIEGIINSSNNKIKSPIVISPVHYWNSLEQGVVKKRILRSILITDRSLFPDEENHDTSLVIIPSMDNSNEEKKENEEKEESVIQLLQLGPHSHATPDNVYIIHLTCFAHGDSKTTPNEKFGSVIKKYFKRDKSEENEEKPAIIFDCNFVQKIYERKQQISEDALPKGLLLFNPSNPLQDSFQNSIDETKRIVRLICPEMIEENSNFFPNIQQEVYSKKKESETESKIEKKFVSLDLSINEEKETEEKKKETENQKKVKIDLKFIEN